MRPLVLLLLPIVVLLAGCGAPGDGGGVARVGGAPPDADGDVAVTGQRGVEVATAEDGLTVRLADAAQTDVLRACAGACAPMEVPRGSVVADTALISLRNVSLNAIGPDGDSALYFYDDGREAARFLRWSDVQGRFQMNADVLALGNMTATGHVGSITLVTLADGQLVTVSTAAAEGFERAIFARGSARLVNGSATIELPAEFTAIALDVGITAQVTPANPGLGLYVTEKTSERVLVRGEPGANGSFDWFVQAPRRGAEDYSP